MPANLPTISLPEGSQNGLGLLSTHAQLRRAEREFVEVNNALGFELYKSLAKKAGDENMVFSPLSSSTSLAMIFLGARGATSWQINSLLQLDHVISFNPHLLYKNVTDTLARKGVDGMTAACVKNLFVDKVKLINFIPVFEVV